MCSVSDKGGGREIKVWEEGKQGMRDDRFFTLWLKSPYGGVSINVCKCMYEVLTPVTPPSCKER